MNCPHCGKQVFEPGRIEIGHPPQNHGDALVKRLEELTLENAQLKNSLVAMDLERELHPVPASTDLHRSRTTMLIDPWWEDIHFDTPELITNSLSRSAFDGVRSRAINAFAAQLVNRGDTFLSYVPVGRSRDITTPSYFRVGAWLKALPNR